MNCEMWYGVAPLNWLKRLNSSVLKTPHKMFSYIKQPPIYIGTIIIAGLITTYFVTLGGTSPAGEVVTVYRGDITQEVFITGVVKAARNVLLSFDRGGTIKSLPFPVGAIVESGAVIS